MTEDSLHILHGLLVGQAIAICSRKGGYSPDEGDQDAILKSVLLRLRCRNPDPSLPHVQNASLIDSAGEMSVAWQRCPTWESYPSLSLQLSRYRRLVADIQLPFDRAASCASLGIELGRSEGHLPFFRGEDNEFPVTLMNGRFWKFTDEPEIRRLLTKLQISSEVLLRTGLSPLESELPPEFQEKLQSLPRNRWGWAVLESNLHGLEVAPLGTETSATGDSGNPFGITFGDNERVPVQRSGERTALDLDPTPWRLFRKLSRLSKGLSLKTLREEWQSIGRSMSPTTEVIRKQLSNVRSALKRARWSLAVKEDGSGGNVVFRLITLSDRET